MLKLGFALGLLFLPLALFSAQAQPSPPAPRTTIVSGVVTLKNKPVQGVTVQLLDQYHNSPNRYRYYATTDEEGQFRITIAAAGKHWISAFAPGYISTEDGMEIEGRLLNITKGEKIENITLEIKRGGVITGQIINSRDAPVIEEVVCLHKLDKDGKPHPYYFSNAGARETRTDDRGVYRFYGLPAGRYLVSAGYVADHYIINPIYPRVFYPNVTSESEAKVIVCAEESEISGIDITLPEQKQPMIKRERTGEITVQLVTETGAGLPNVKAHIIPVTENGQIIPGAGGAYDTTDEEGNFKIPKYEPSLYRIQVSEAAGYAPKRTIIQSDRDNITIIMVKGGVITGSVTNAKTEPVPGAVVAVVMVRDAEGDPMRGIELHRTTDDRGVYRFWGLTPGTYVVFTDNIITGPFAAYQTPVRRTYHALSPRVTATEVTVTRGGETSGIDLRSRED